MGVEQEPRTELTMVVQGTINNFDPSALPGT
jgi:hypothetical protein